MLPGVLLSSRALRPGPTVAHQHQRHCQHRNQGINMAYKGASSRRQLRVQLLKAHASEGGRDPTRPSCRLRSCPAQWQQEQQVPQSEETAGLLPHKLQLLSSGSSQNPLLTALLLLWSSSSSFRTVS